MMLEIEELVDVVDALNHEIFDEDWVNKLGWCFTLQYSTYYSQILFNDVVLWNSENDEREYNEDTDKFEPLLTYCKREFCKAGNNMLILNKLIQ